MHVLVTGGCGFIGRYVVAALLAEDVRVTVLDAGLPAAHATPPAAPPGARLIRGDVRDPAVVAACLRDADAVVHLAAMVGLGVDLADLPAYAGCNDLGTAVLLAAMAAAGTGTLVLASSMVVYGEGGYRCRTHGPVRPAPRRTEDLRAGRFDPRCPACATDLASVPVTEDAALEPRSVYAATKVAQEHLSAAWAWAGAGRVTALRFHNVYGPGMPRDTPYAGVASIFRSAVAAGQAPRVFEDGRQQRDFVHVHDVARACVLALRRPAGDAYRAYNVASGHPYPVGRLAADLAAAVGGPEPVVTGEFRAGDVRHVVGDPGRAAAELGFRAQVPLLDGVREFAGAPLR